MRPCLVVLVVLSGSCASAPPAPTQPTAGRVALPLPKWTEQQRITHLLNRAAFGPSPADVAHLHAIGLEAWLSAQLAPGVDPAIEHRLSGFKALGLSIAEATAQYVPLQKRLKALGLEKDEEDEQPRQLLIEATQAKLIRAVQSQRQLEEVLVDFWFNHFNVSAEKNRTRWMVIAYERDAIRPHVLGRFRELLGATAKHPAMLWYLDNWQSVKDGFVPPGKLKQADFMPRGLNENFARELLELHTLGVDAGYTQEDLHEAARALTGWSIEIRPNSERFGQFVFHPMAHDSGAKHVFGLELAAGGGQDDGEKLLDALARHPATARFIAKKLCTRFVSDTPSPELIDRVAAEFLRTDGDLRATYLAIFQSPEFWSDTAFAAKTKLPLEFVASAVRAVGNLEEVRLPLAKPLEQLGQPLYRCSPPTGYSEFAAPWVSAGALVARINFGLKLAKGRIPGVEVKLPERQATNAATIDAVALRVLGRAPTDATRETIERALESHDDVEDAETRRIDPALIAGLLLGSPEFQKQ